MVSLGRKGYAAEGGRATGERIGLRRGLLRPRFVVVGAVSDRDLLKDGENPSPSATAPTAAMVPVAGGVPDRGLALHPWGGHSCPPFLEKDRRRGACAMEGKGEIAMSRLALLAMTALRAPAPRGGVDVIGIDRKGGCPYSALRVLL